MKKKKWELSLCITLTIAFVFYILGFRITYTPNMENNWKAISAAGQWVGVTISGILTWIIISQTNKINKRQSEEKITFQNRQEESLDMIYPLFICFYFTCP